MNDPTEPHFGASDMSIADMRRHYKQATLRKADVDADPIRQFDCWFKQAVESNSGEWYEPNSFSLATSSRDGKSSVRIMLLKDYNGEGFTFYTNYDSRKGIELDDNPYASMAFHWPSLERQVRIEGRVSRVSVEVSREYHQCRPRSNQLGAMVSQQSAAVANRKILEDKFAELDAKFEGQEVPLPDNWGGYLITPDMIEFWQGRPSRLHDRICYTREEDGPWQIDRLSP